MIVRLGSGNNSSSKCVSDDEAAVAVIVRLCSGNNSSSSKCVSGDEAAVAVIVVVIIVVVSVLVVMRQQ